MEYNYCEVKVVNIYTPPSPGLFTEHSVSLPWLYDPTSGSQMKPVHTQKHNALINLCSFPHQIFRLAFVRLPPPIYLYSDTSANE